MSENPYQSPNYTGDGAIVVPWHRITPIVVTIATVGFWFGLLLAVLLLFIRFLPGAECAWFIVAGVLIAVGLFIPKRRYRIAAIILCSLCFYYAYDGYIRGVEYRQWHKKELDTVSEVHTPPLAARPQTGVTFD